MEIDEGGRKKGLVSVVMPVYNEADYVGEAIESIQKQTYSPLEIIIVEDGSTDETRKIAQKYEREDKRIEVIESPKNLGNYSSRNAGVQAAKGVFVAVMDGDDIALPRRIERQVRFLHQHPEHVMVGAQVRLIDAEGWPLGRRDGLHAEHEAIDSALMDGGWSVVHPTVLMRREAFMTVGGYQERYPTNADHDLYLRLAERGRIANLSEVLLHYRRHYGSITYGSTNSNPTDQRRNLYLIRQRARKRRGLPPLETDALSQENEESSSEAEKMKLHLYWARMALSNRHLTTSCKHILKALAIRPVETLARIAGWTY